MERLWTDIQNDMKCVRFKSPEAIPNLTTNKSKRRNHTYLASDENDILSGNSSFKRIYSSK